MKVEQKERRLTPSALLEHWDNGAPVAIPLGGEPELQLRIDPPRARQALRAPVGPAPELPPNLLTHVAVDTVVDRGTHYLEISTAGKDLLVDGYAMLMVIADRIQFGGAEPLTAFAETLETWEAILAARTRLSPAAEVGLFGELLVVRSLLATGAGLDAWRGGLGEEHDFGFGSADLEVKTTSGERREHWVHGLSQLAATPGNELWVLSIQVTGSGAGQGQTLPELIDEVLAGVAGEDRDRVERNLAGVGWHEAQRDLYTERRHLRSQPLLLRVEDEFPRLTAPLLAQGGIDTAPLLRVDYVIDLTDRKPSQEPPPALAEILAHLNESADA